MNATVLETELLVLKQIFQENESHCDDIFLAYI